jgi:hypothetical protein
MITLSDDLKLERKQANEIIFEVTTYDYEESEVIGDNGF